MSDKFNDQLNNEDFLKNILNDLDKIGDVSNAGGFGAAGVGAGVGAAASFAALYGLGTVGLSAAGITSGLAAAGALIGGGMVAGIGVLAAPVAILAVGGFAIFHSAKNKRVKQLQNDVLAKAITKQSSILAALKDSKNKSESTLAELKARNSILTQIIVGLQAKIKK